MRSLLPLLIALLATSCADPACDGVPASLEDGFRVYEGGWPVNRDADELALGTWDATPPRVGDAIPPVVGMDQYGQEVAVADFAGQGRWTVLMVVDTTDPLSGEVLEWLGDCDDPWTEHWSSDLVCEAVRLGRVGWVVLAQTPPGCRAADQRELADLAWSAAPMKVPVVGDVDGRLSRWLGQGGPHALTLVDDALRLVVVADDAAVMDAVGYDELGGS